MEDKWQELRQLEAQRSDLITKLAKIDEKKEMVSEEVYGKVKTEYEEKLKNIDIKMGVHTDLIKEELTNISENESKILSNEKEINMQIEEIELRYSIGEYDEDSYMSLSAEKKDDRSKARDDLENLRKRKKWLEDFVQVKDIEESVASEPPAEIPAQPPSEPAVAEKKPEKADTDIQIEEHILEEKLPEEETRLDELLVEEEAVKQDIVDEPKVEGEPEAQPVKEKGKDAPCPKCGHLNTLDSWYCEKCGAEILDSPPAS
jgi:hypothetical protein